MGTKTLDRLRRDADDPDGEHGIDPRIRARRILVQRDEDRSRVGKVMVVLAVLAIVAGSVAALRSPLLDVDHIVVGGAKRTHPEAIVAASGVRRRVSMGDVALGRASRQVASLPWVLRATVRREWPGTVRITVTERHALAEVRRANGGWLLVDVTGRVLAQTPTSLSGLVHLTGRAAGPPGRWLSAFWSDPLHVAASLPPDLAREVATVSRDGRGTGLALTDGMTVVLGDGADIGSKMDALRTLLAQPDRHCFATINLRVATAPALTRRPGCA